jgi:hypothetical protein
MRGYVLPGADAAHRAGLMVEDNGGCGGAGVSFTGLYHRK